MKQVFRRTWRPGMTGVFALLAMCSPWARGGEDVGSWHALSLRFFDNEHWTLSTVGQVRFRDDSSELFAYGVTPQVAYKASAYLRLGMNYTYLPTKPAGGDDFLDQHRWETEVTPRWPVNDWLTLDLRNRFELRWLEGKPGTNERSRHRPQATFYLNGFGPLESIYVNNEFFYDFDDHLYNQNRLVPLGLNLRLNSHAVFTTCYMLLSTRGGDEWRHSHVLGTQLSLSF